MKRSVLSSIIIAVALGIIALILFSGWGLIVSTIFKVSQISDTQISYTQIQYYQILYERCKDDPAIVNKSICDEYLKLATEYQQKSDERKKLYDVWSNPLLYIILIVVIIVIGLLIRIGAIQIPISIKK